MVSRDRTTSKVNKLKHRTFHLTIRKHFFSVKVTEHWYKLPWEAVGYPLLEIFRNHPDMVLGCLLYIALLEQGHWTR